MLARFSSRYARTCATSSTAVTATRALLLCKPQNLPNSTHHQALSRQTSICQQKMALAQVRNFSSKDDEEDMPVLQDVESVLYGTDVNNIDVAMTQICQAILKRIEGAKASYVEYEHFKYAALIVSKTFEGKDHEERRSHVKALLEDALKKDELPELWEHFDCDVRCFTPDEVPEEDRAEFESMLVKPEEKVVTKQPDLRSQFDTVKTMLFNDPRDPETKYTEAMREYFNHNGAKDGVLTEADFLASEKIGCEVDGLEWDAMTEVRAKECFQRGARGKKTIDFAGFLEAFDWRFKQLSLVNPTDRAAITQLMIQGLLQGKK